MLIRLSNNRILNLAEIAEVLFTSGPIVVGVGCVPLVAELTLLTGGTGRGLATVGAGGSEAEALQAALRARPEQFAEVESGHYVNLLAILSADLTTVPEKKPASGAAPRRPSEVIKQLPIVRGWWRWSPSADSAPEAGTFMVTGTAAVNLRDALMKYVGRPFDPDPFAAASGGGRQSRIGAQTVPAGSETTALA